MRHRDRHALLRQTAYGTDLERRFCEATTPCIVTFRHPYASEEAVAAAVRFAYDVLRDVEVSHDSKGGPQLEGEAVQPESVVSVEIVERVPAVQRGYRTASMVARPV